MKKFFSAFLSVAVQKEQKNIGMLCLFSLAMGLLALSNFSIVFGMGIDAKNYKDFFSIAWLPIVMFMFSFSIFITVITRVQIMKEEKKETKK